MTLEQLINRKHKIIEKHNRELRQLLSQCNHEGYTEQKQSYYEGSYYDKAYTAYWNQCKLCGKMSERVYDRHHYYG